MAREGQKALLFGQEFWAKGIGTIFGHFGQFGGLKEGSLLKRKEPKIFKRANSYFPVKALLRLGKLWVTISKEEYLGPNFWTKKERLFNVIGRIYFRKGINWAFIANWCGPGFFKLGQFKQRPGERFGPFN